MIYKRNFLWWALFIVILILALIILNIITSNPTSNFWDLITFLGLCAWANTQIISIEVDNKTIKLKYFLRERVLKDIKNVTLQRSIIKLFFGTNLIIVHSKGFSFIYLIYWFEDSKKMLEDIESATELKIEKDF